jgi:hypothetical protein
VVVEGHATGGSGGYIRSPTARAGNGASVDLVDAVAGTTTGALVLVQSATGGDGGVASGGGEAGLGGDASSSLTRSAIARSFSLGSTARGGGGGQAGTGSSAPDRAPDGGGASALAEGTNQDGDLAVLARSEGGAGGSSASSGVVRGRGGDANAEAFGEVHGDGHRLVVGDVDGLTSGAIGGGTGVGPEESRAGDASSRSRAVASGDSSVLVFDRAVGGSLWSSTLRPPRPPGDSLRVAGSAVSVAEGQNAGESSVVVLSTAEGGAASHQFFGRVPADAGGDADAMASATGLGSVEAGADARSFGPGVARARAFGAGASGDATATAVVSDGHSLVARARAEVIDEARVEALSRSGGEAAMAPPDTDAFATSLLSPSPEALAAVLEGNPRVAEALEEAGSVLALGQLAFSNGQAPDCDDILLTSEFELIPGGWLPPEGFLLGFLDPAAGVGEGELRFRAFFGEELLLEEEFDDPAAAALGLADSTLELTDLDPWAGSLRLVFDFETSDLGAGFSTGILIANVPEPSAALLLAFGLALITLSRRGRRRSSAAA